MVSKIEVKEMYSNYIPPVNVVKIINSLIGSIPEEYLQGLQYIVLRNASSLPRDERRKAGIARGRKVKLAECRGAYYQARQGNLAYIELFVDNIILNCPTLFLKIPLFRDLIFDSVLYHEIGHHLHHVKFPEYKEKEDIAQKWYHKLGSMHLKKNYWYLAPLFFIIGLILKKKSKQ